MTDIGRVQEIDLEDEDDVNIIRLGWLSGTGLIDEIIDAVVDIAEHAGEALRYEGATEGMLAARKLGDAWMRLYHLLKAVEEVGND
jgi:hypothetical protein